MTALAFSYFVKQNVDIAVIEVGLGGQLDSTNVLTPILSVITNIGLDHTEFLGNTLTQIAREKAGIIKPDVPCVIGETHPQTMNVFIDKARECNILGDGLETTNCRIWFADQCGYLKRVRQRVAPECELKGNYQEHNLQTAFVALNVLNNFQFSIFNFQFSVREGFAHVCSMTGLRGRWEILSNNPLTICDTGHNSHGIQYVARQLKELTNPNIWIVFGMVNDKDTDVVMKLLPSNDQLPTTNDKYHYIFTRPNTQRARSAEEMLALWGKEGAIAIDNPKEAIAYAKANAKADDAIFIGGSNYLVGEILAFNS